MYSRLSVEYPCILFFFQAEDGIRDTSVTGVQTCALPISSRHRGPRGPARPGRSRARTEARGARSEERRVGKECRSGWSRYHDKKSRIGEVLLMEMEV